MISPQRFSETQEDTDPPYMPLTLFGVVLSERALRQGSGNAGTAASCDDGHRAEV